MVQERGERLSPSVEEQLCFEMKTILLAGHETSAAMLTWTLLELTRNPECMQKVVLLLHLWPPSQSDWESLHGMHNFLHDYKCISRKTCICDLYHLHVTYLSSTFATLEHVGRTIDVLGRCLIGKLQPAMMQSNGPAGHQRVLVAHGQLIAMALGLHVCACS